MFLAILFLSPIRKGCDLISFKQTWILRFTKFGWYWPSGSREEIKNMNSLWQRQQEQWRRHTRTNSIRIFSSGELKLNPGDSGNSLSNKNYNVTNRIKLKIVYVLKLYWFCLRWYGTPCNIFKDERILKNDYNHGYKNLPIYNICPQNAFIKFHKRDKK